MNCPACRRKLAQVYYQSDNPDQVCEISNVYYCVTDDVFWELNHPVKERLAQGDYVQKEIEK